MAIIKSVGYDCSKCIKYCITMPVNCVQEHYIIYNEICDGCGLCIPVCKSESIYWNKKVE
ncbi:MAG TPA: 4Fe-4S binding protein [Bacteroidales bacterium]|nr:4Fe-4S binding protein [Bacteroidales bacterium]HPS17782.1 4Fe-4S binding protein [Bacteroidales bacterium]